MYSVASYKDGISRSIDWSKYKNSLIPDPKPEKKAFVKINYLKPKVKTDMRSSLMTKNIRENS